MFPEESLPVDRLGYVLALRDPWMHRVDVARATGRPFDQTDADRVVVAHVVGDLGRAWQGPPIVLELTGSGAGRWALDDGPPVATVRAGAGAYLRTLAGRDDDPELEVHGDAGAGAAAAAARVVF